MTEDTLQQLAEKLTRKLLAEIHFGSEKSGPCSATNKENSDWLDGRCKHLAPLSKPFVQSAYLAGEKAGLEQAARLCDTWQLFFPGRAEIAEAGDEVADMLGVEIRKRKEE